jgi:23S rRNA G2069 N7-methylase RlmK/C1962 C5-methylase RlmI
VTDKDLRQAEYLGNRLKKRRRQLGRWTRKTATDCFRLYDVDIPEIPLAVDIYGKSLLMSLYERPYDKDPAEEDAWLALMADSAAESLSLDRKDIRVKRRKRQRGVSQYEALSRTGHEFAVREQGLSFLVNLDDYLDSGLFLDHRPLRERIRGMSAGKRVLNLFCYTGSFSVYAASGGAAAVSSVDLSQGYLDWARRNFELNGLDAARHAFLKADALAWIPAAAARREEWDLIVIDPPTFSNSKSMAEDLDLAEDYPSLLSSALELLARDGTMFFSTNSRRFKLDPASIRGAAVLDLGDSTVPLDFRDRKIHRAWELRRA